MSELILYASAHEKKVDHVNLAVFQSFKLLGYNANSNRTLSSGAARISVRRGKLKGGSASWGDFENFLNKKCISLAYFSKNLRNNSRVWARSKHC